MSLDREIIAASKAWPIVEAQRLLARVEKRPPAKGFVLFETGYGPSGLPHIGTFAEVFRTTLVRQAFARLSDLPTELYAFSDDMDGLRKVPDNVPNQAMVAEHLGRPLTAIPDPFGTHESYGAHMNARLQSFLDQFGFAYTFKSGSEEYRKGTFNAALPQGAGAARCHPRGRAADAGAGAARHLQPDPADLAQDRPRAAGADRGVPARRRARSCSATRTAR